MADQDWLSTHGQAQAVKARAVYQQRLARARVYAAYVNLAQSESWEIVVTDLVEGVLLRPCLNDVDRGKQHLVLEMLRIQASALQGSQLPDDPHIGNVLGGFA